MREKDDQNILLSKKNGLENSTHIYDFTFVKKYVKE